MNHVERDNGLTFIARTNWRNSYRPFGIRRVDRRSHMYVIGKTGTGKSTLLHVLGGLDGLAVLRALLEVRSDVRVVANELLAELPGLNELLLPYGVFSRRPQKERLAAIGEALDRGEAVIF
ncbi:MAG: hypothetical protein B7Z72_11580, partial [Gemmatimonadetes bacterium 21-71-4]